MKQRPDFGLFAAIILIATMLYGVIVLVDSCADRRAQRQSRFSEP